MLYQDLFGTELIVVGLLISRGTSICLFRCKTLQSDIMSGDKEIEDEMVSFFLSLYALGVSPTYS